MQLIQTCVRRFTIVLQAFSLVALVLLAGTARAQIAGTGSIQGTITDTTGAVIPNAAITLTEKATLVAHSTKSDGSGVYVFPNIDIGTYSLSVSVPGFETYTSSGNVLEVGSSISINVKMTVGAQEQKVEVQATGLALQTEDVSFKQTVDATALTEMPLNGTARQITALVTGSGGAAPAPGGDFTGSKYSYQTIAVSIAGGNGNSTMWRLDGGDNNDYMGNGNLPFPFPDAVAQFSVESTALGAEDGMHSGGLVNAVTRSGTNRFHGTGFEFIRNNYLDSQNFFSTCTPVAPATTCNAKDTLHQNEYGGTFGGPVSIPKLFSGKDKLFFFVGYQFLKNDQSTSATTSHVPTTANLAGDFSVTDGAGCEANGKFLQLVDPITGVLIPGDKYATVPTWNAQALALQKYLPAIVPANDPSNCGVVTYAVPSQIFDKQFVTRIDYSMSARNNLYGRYLLDGYQAPSFFSTTNILLATPAPGNYERVQTGTIGEDFTLNAHTVNSAHVTVTRRVDVRSSAPGINACTLGVNIFCAVATGFQSTVTGKFNTYCGTCAPGHYNDNSLSFNDDVTLVRGKHQIIFGGEFVRNQLNIVGAYESNGNFTFSGTYSGNGPAGGSAAGDADLDLLEGALNKFEQSKQQQNALRGPVPSLYFQDTFHATKQLTMVAGIRWSPQFMPVDFFNRGSEFNYQAFLANQISTVYPTAPAGSTFYGDPGVSRQFTQNSPWQFSPNAGVSWDPNGSGKTVFRGGVELIYDEVNFFTAQRVNQNPPFATAVDPPTSGQLSFANPWVVGGNNYNTFPQPVIPTKAQAVFPAQGQFIVLPPHFHPSYTIQYTASVQHDFSHGWQLQLDYIGNGTRHSPIGYPYNNAVFIPGVWGAGGTGCSPIVTTGPAAVKPGAAGTNCSTTGNQNSRFALTIANPTQGNQYTGGGGGSVLVGDYATANYNGLVTSVNHRLSSSFSLLANWTWSKCLNEQDGIGDLAGSSVSQPNNPKADYAPCGADYRHIENVVLILKSNFGFSNGIEKAILNNWEMAPKIQILSGAPFTVTSGQDNSLTDNSSLDRPNLVPGVPVYQRVAFRKLPVSELSREYINPAAFQQVTANCPGFPTTSLISAATCPQLGTLGNVGRNSFRGIPAYNLDAQISRLFPIREFMSLDFRIEAFNLLNHPNFNLPTGATTGTIGATSGGNAVLTSANFGQVSSTSNQARVFQGSVKVSF
jgi:Carboxypeptidase regulatory-like domain